MGSDYARTSARPTIRTACHNGEGRGSEGSAAGKAGTSESADFWTHLSPLPSFSVIPDQEAPFFTWAERLGIPLTDLVAVGEAQASRDHAPVGVIVGAWDRNTLTTTLSAMRYQWIDIGDVRHSHFPRKPRQ